MTAGIGWSRFAFNGDACTFSNDDRTVVGGEGSGTSTTIQSVKGSGEDLTYAEVVIVAHEDGDVSIDGSDDHHYLHIDYTGQTHSPVDGDANGLFPALAHAAGDTVRICWSKTTVWFAINDGEWNGDNANHNPETALGGFPTHFDAGEFGHVKAAMNNFTEASRTLNDSRDTFTYSLPTGATPLAEVPDRVSTGVWDTALDASTFTVSEDGLTVTAPSGGGSVRVADPIPVGEKKYLEVTLGVDAHGVFGVVTHDNGTFSWIDQDGYVGDWSGNFAPTLAAGDTLGICIDTTADRRMWFTKDGSTYWPSDSADGNPVTINDGMGIAWSGDVYVRFYVQNEGSTRTLNTGTSPFKYTPPEGYSALYQEEPEAPPATEQPPRAQRLVLGFPITVA